MKRPDTNYAVVYLQDVVTLILILNIWGVHWKPLVRQSKHPSNILLRKNENSELIIGASQITAPLPLVYHLQSELSIILFKKIRKKQINVKYQQ